MNPDPCGGVENENDGCGVIFPRMALDTVHCPLCKKLKVPNLSQEALATLQETLHQCMECGLCGTMLKSPCGTCKRKAHDENDASDTVSLASQNSRRRQLVARLHRPGSSTVTVGPTTPLSELVNLRENTGSLSHFTIFIEVRRSSAPSSIDKILGKTCVPYPENTTFLALKEMAIADVNPRWTKDHMSDLQCDEVEIRAHKNVTLSPAIDFVTLRQWYNQHNVAGVREVYLKTPAGIKGGKGSTFSLELFIHEDRYFERTGENDADDSDDAGEIVLGNSKNRKRKGKQRQGTQASKRVKGSSVTTLRSTFAPDVGATTRGQVVSTSNTITFNRVICTINVETGCSSLTESSDIETGLIERETMFLSAADRGKTKDVYKLVIGGMEYVAKKLVDAGSSQGCGKPGKVTLDEANDLLTSDLIRLKRMAVFAGTFMARAIRAGTEISAFQVSDGFLIKTYHARNANGPGSADTSSFGEDGSDNHTRVLTSVYLVEPRRASSAVLKFSGTLGAQNRQDKRSATIMAFSHFVVEDTACQYMFADIQGSMDRNTVMHNESVLTLFDPMTHTPASQSGLGDHGLEGFDDFLKCHKCTLICSSMELCKLSVVADTIQGIRELEADPDAS